MVSPQAFLEAARVPTSLKPQRFGRGWYIERRSAADTILGEIGAGPYGDVGWPSFTLLRRLTAATIHLDEGIVVMEDSARELRKHLPIWMAAKGRVLKTGLGLGCVVRGLLANPAVEHVDVVEIDADVIRVCAGDLAHDPRVTIHHADAETWDFTGLRWDYAWHDLHSFDEEHLQLKHSRLLARYLPNVADGQPRRQGAWAFPREPGRRCRLLGSPRRERR